jgi:NADPH:quinone reductase-like Zn-dependent oxidoreductase
VRRQHACSAVAARGGTKSESRTEAGRQACKERVYGLHRAGELRAVIDASEFAGLGRAADAVEHMLSGRSAGKVVLRVAPPEGGPG